MEPQNRTILDSWNGLGYPQVSELIREAFRDVYNRLGAGSYVEKTWAELKALRDEAGLSSGTYYRITDYVATTTQENTRSAGHPFDIIVVATGADALSEDAIAILHEGDTYFSGAGARLEAWSLKYCLDNSPRFAWADSENGKGVIWWMRDEWGNEAPYDFKNIQFKRYQITGFGQNFKGNQDVQSVLLYDPDDNPLCYGTKDIYGNEVPGSTEHSEEWVWVYTFTGIDRSSSLDVPEFFDMSTYQKRLSDETIQSAVDDGCGLDTESNVRNNVIMPSFAEYMEDDEYYQGRTVLNNIVFYGVFYDNGYDDEYQVPSCYGNRFGVNCHDCTFGNYFQNNTFGNSCGGNTFGNDCYSNTFGNGCSSNTFGNDCYSNTFGNGCYSNTFGNGCNWNTFGNGCQNNTFGNSCQNNTFGNYFQNNTFGNSCYNNTFGNGCSSNTFGNGCYSNTFGNYFRSNTFGNNCFQNTFGNNCFQNTFGNGCSSNTFGNNCFQNTFGNNFQYGTVFEGVTYVNVPGSNSPTKYCTILAGTSGTNGNNKLTISFIVNKSYPQFAGKNTVGTLKIWNPADLAE